MPRIEQYISQRGLDPVRQPRVNLDQSVSRGLQSAGGAVSNAGQTAQQMELIRLQHNNQIAEFQGNQEFRRFGSEMSGSFDGSVNSMDPMARITDEQGSTAGLTETFIADYDKKSDELLAKLPEHMRPKFEELVQTQRAQFNVKSARVEHTQRQNGYLEGIKEVQQDAENEIWANPDNYKAAYDEGRRAILSSGRTDKEKLLREWDEVAEFWHAKRRIQDDPEGTRQELTNFGDTSQNIIQREEGFRAKAYADTRTSDGSFAGYRAGYGADIVVREDGRVENVTKNTVVTRADANRTMEYIVNNREGKRAREQVGDAWRGLSGNVKDALYSVAYNYGSLPNSVASAAQTGDTEAIAKAVGALGANPERRQREAALIRGQAAPSRYGNIPLDQRLKLIGEADRQIRAIEIADNSDGTEFRHEITKQGYDMIHFPEQHGEMTAEWLEMHRDTLTVSDYKAFSKSLLPESETRKTDPEEYLRLLDLVEEDPEQAIEEIRDLYANDQVAKADYKTLTSRARREIDSERGAQYESEMRSYVKKQLTPREKSPKSHYARQLDAMFAFDDWLKNNPQADREEMRKQAQTISDDYRRISYASGVTSLPPPKFSSVPPGMLTELELNKSKARTVLQLQAGNINAREAAGQAALIRRWFDVLKYKD